MIKLKIANTQYPNSETITEIISSSLIVGLLFYVFLITFQPFNTHAFIHQYKYLILFPYAVITFTVFSFVSYVCLGFRNWTIKKELIKIFIILFISSIFCYLYNSLFISKVSLSFENYLYMLFYTVAIGTPISITYVLGRYIYLKNKYEKIAEDIDDLIREKSSLPYLEEFPEIKTLIIFPEGKGVELKMTEDEFIFAESADNYCIIYYFKNDKVRKDILRLTLTNLSSQIETESIKRCHRSFIVNLKKVNGIKGNAQGYKLSIKNLDQEISVSRYYINDIIPLIPIIPKVN